MAIGIGNILGFGQNITDAGGSYSPVAGKAMLELGSGGNADEVFKSTYCVDSECSTIIAKKEGRITESRPKFRRAGSLILCGR